MRRPPSDVGVISPVLRHTLQPGSTVIRRHSVLVSYEGARVSRVVARARWADLLAEAAPLDDVALVAPDEQWLAVRLDHRVHGGTLPEQPPHHVLELGEGDRAILLRDTRGGKKHIIILLNYLTNLK